MIYVQQYNTNESYRAFSQATGCDKMTHFVWIIQEYNMW